MVKHKASDKKITAIIQARMKSQRLPGKVLLNLEGKPVLIRVIERVLKSKKIQGIIVATTDRKEDDAIVKAVGRLNHPMVAVFRGSERNVLNRYFKAAKEFSCDVIIRITSDCPLIDPGVIDKVIDGFESFNGDYVSNILLERTYPRGLDVEVFSFDVLKKMSKLVKSQSDKEHVTLYIRKNPQLFLARNIKHRTDYSFHRWTLDEKDDYELLKVVYKNVYKKNPDFLMQDVIKFFEKNPKIIEINKEVKQKK